MQALKGTHDILPDEVYKWDYMEGVIRDVCARYGYKEIRTPIIEATELFQRGIGDGLRDDAVAFHLRVVAHTAQ